MAKNDSIVYDPIGDSSIDGAAEQAIALAKSKHKPVTFNFNGISCVAKEDSRPDDVVQAFMTAIDKRHRDYENSPEGKAEAARRDREVKSKQSQINDLEARLADTLKQGMTPTIVWIKSYSDLADDNGVKKQLKKVSAALTGAGYKEDDCTGDKFVKGDKQCMGKYIIGQVISCLNSGMPPHPMASDFCADYLKMPDKPAPGTQLTPVKK